MLVGGKSGRPEASPTPKRDVRGFDRGSAPRSRWCLQRVHSDEICWLGGKSGRPEASVRQNATYSALVGERSALPLVFGSAFIPTRYVGWGGKSRRPEASPTPKRDAPGATFVSGAHAGRIGGRSAQSVCRVDRLRFGSGYGILSCAVSMSRNCGGPGVLGVGPDRFDRQVKLIGAIDFARHAIGLARHEVVGFREVMQARRIVWPPEYPAACKRWRMTAPGACGSCSSSSRMSGLKGSS
jgi:hypothetical protein